MQMSAIDTSEEVIDGFTVTAKRKTVWRKELALVEEFVRICDKYELQYFISGGTLLGAVRHKGFIPWDDDIDIMMSRNYYETFIAVAQSELKQGYNLQHYTTEKNYDCGHIQLRDDSTTALLAADYSNLKCNKNLGIFIDIFPFDNIPDDDRKAISFTKKIKFKKRVIRSKIHGHYRGVKGFFKRLYFAIFARDSEKAIADVDKKSQKYNGKTHRIALTTFMPGYTRNMWAEAWFSEIIKLPFEHLMLSAPKYFDEVLRTQYGDYMQMPKDIPHTMHGSCYFDTENSYTDYVNISKERFDELFEEMIL